MSRTRLWILICLALLVGIAGCSLPETTETPETNATESTTYPPGATGDAITNTTELFRAHEAIVAESDYVLRYEFDGNTDLDNTSDGVPVTETTTFRSNLSAERHLERVSSRYPTRGGRLSNKTWYTEDGVRYVRYDGETADGTPVEPYLFVDYSFRGADFERVSHTGFITLDMTYPAVYEWVVSNSTFRHNRTFKRGGATYHNYSVTGTADSETNATVTVRSDGFIDRMHIRTRIDGTAVRLVQDYTLRDSVVVVAPSWTDEALRVDGSPPNTGGSSCGTNDGDPDYDEDNDRDNDGLCDES